MLAINDEQVTGLFIGDNCSYLGKVLSLVFFYILGVWLLVNIIWIMMCPRRK
jgi:hypothetical protein